MTAEESAKIRADLSNAMLELTENFTPIIDAADGIKADMERRGWSPTAAETVALEWLRGALSMVWKSAP